eukprot:CAMPEP_0202963206 /NCGR_PEP_ID=MMETSP1396-20130829/7198_1 /ASSEMBLY_ACC=CAM_ASM_000872 /TAXON_ID= /ORGANISM="Pseudokeronopsis sp., Strain Brazil" /LENGTH=85 /DNA_ID=CAMNT_0049684229 /DNA_START=697 /DNA_END=954 /DNA_ORIENTATION=-
MEEAKYQVSKQPSIISDVKGEKSFNLEDIESNKTETPKLEKKVSDLVDSNQLGSSSEDNSNLHRQSPRHTLMRNNLRKVEIGGYK